MTTCQVLHVVGARPNFMKIAPVLRSCEQQAGFENFLVHTGQHYDEKMSDLFFDELRIPRPDLHLGVGSGTHAAQTAAIMEKFEPVILERRPDLVLVVGDVNSTMACSIVAVKLGVPVAHVEAGLRSFDRTMPEEINRLVTDSISELLFASEPSGAENLEREGIDPSRIHLVGNVMIDTLLAFRESARSSGIRQELALGDRDYGVMTLHRPANVDDPAALAAIMAPITELSSRMPVIFPVHPRTRQVLETAPEILPEGSGVRLVEPLGYLDFMSLMMHARIVLTDSGGIQEETTILDVPCVTIRENTERPITLTHGTNRLAGVTSEGIDGAIRSALEMERGAGKTPPLWDGRASERIAEVLACWRDSKAGKQASRS